VLHQFETSMKKLHSNKTHQVLLVQIISVPTAEH